MSITLLHVSDTHCGLLAGLFPPEMELTYLNNEKKKHNATATSLWVWDCYQRLISTAIDFAEGDQVIVIHTGDITHGGTFAEYLYSSWQEHQISIAVRCLSELRRIPTLAGIRLCYGTAVHDYGMSSAARQIASDCAAWGYGMWCGSYGHELVDGGEIDYAHRGPNHSNNTDQACMARRYAIGLCKGFLERGEIAPVAIMRGHIHKRTLSQVVVPWGKADCLTTISVGSPLCGHNEFSRNASMNAPITQVGGALLRISKGRVVEQLSAIWERSNRVMVEGCVGHPFAGEIN